MATVAQHGHGRESPKSLCLLSLDGGGIRGLSSLLILQEIMDQIRRTCQLSETPLPCEYFDLICGTSTGGLIALLLGRLRMSVNDAIGVYLSVAREAFTPGPWQWLSKNRFRHEKLEQVVKSVVEQQTRDSDAPLADPLGADACFTFVLALQKLVPTGEPTFLRTYASQGSDPAPCSIWQAARATTAAPSFYEPISVPIRPAGVHSELVDAGMGFNNPAEQVLDEAVRIWGRDCAVGCLLSIGTGHPKVVGLSGSTKLGVLYRAAKACVTIATDCEKTHEKMLGLIRTSALFRHSEGAAYIRFNVDQGLQGVELQEWHNLPKVTAHTHNYLNKRAIGDQKDHCVKRLIERDSNSLKNNTSLPPDSDAVTDAATMLNQASPHAVTQTNISPSVNPVMIPRPIYMSFEQDFVSQPYWHSPYILAPPRGTSPAALSRRDIEEFYAHTKRFRFSMENKLARLVHQYRDAMVAQANLFPSEEQQRSVFKLMMSAADGLIHQDPETMRTLLHYMAMNGVTDLLQCFVEAEFSVNAGDSDYRTPLHLAVICNHVETVRILIEKCNANVHAKDLKKLLPWHCALTIGQDCLDEHGRRTESKDKILRILAKYTDPQQVQGNRSLRILKALKENPDAIIIPHRDPVSVQVS